ncbi:sulfite oxidase [Acidipila sp. EB88]|uniref:sulfite oxidase n=1 Tax=Acidipila sp. EB88 TaxID=2305226 RepID=UPI000F5D8625|nr:sulfite oxidase [Acidipila sp. EB88]RRA50391.1 sulfite oxidase [Acidipila sp. EB88]
MAAKMAPHDANPGLIIREREPVNLEYPFDQLDEFLTPNDLFYIRSHFKAPALTRDTFELSISGAVQRPFSLSYKDLLAMPSVTRPATLECAGNGRIFLVPQVKGAQWQLGAVSTAQWTGVPLVTLLERAGLDPDACEVVFEAADKGKPKEEPVPPGDTQYARSISLAKAADTVIAWAMNGEELSADHGFPVRAIVPGHYGMASVKWLTAIRVVDKPFQGYWQTSDYGYWEYQDGNPVRLALGAMAIKSAIARPRTREVLTAGQSYMVSGASWGGDIVTATELSVDDGTSWQPVRFLDEPQPFAWRRWEFAWTVPEEKGVYMLRSRATDNAGNTQPEEHDKRFGTYVIHHTFPIEVVVR